MRPERAARRRGFSFDPRAQIVTSRPPAGIALLAALAIGCGPSSTRASGGPVEPAELRALTESRARALVAEVLADQGVEPATGWSVAVTPDARLGVDVRLGGSDFGIAWISPQDRAQIGDAVPAAEGDRQLRIVPGVGDDAGAQVLILDHASYEYTTEREHVQRGAPGASEAEVRLQRDVRDFLQYVRGQGGI